MQGQVKNADNPFKYVNNVATIPDVADNEACDEAIKQLEQIDDDAEAVGVKFVKTDDPEFAAEFGIEEFPAILYFEDKQPSIYDGKRFNTLMIKITCFLNQKSFFSCKSR